jgi:hypothetical protein
MAKPRYIENFLKLRCRIFDTYIELYVPARNDQLTDLGWVREVKARVEGNLEVVSTETVKVHTTIQ